MRVLRGQLSPDFGISSQCLLLEFRVSVSQTNEPTITSSNKLLLQVLDAVFITKDSSCNFMIYDHLGCSLNLQFL